jgi:hypothetical protein|tara:strand:+ start:683 stop:874 length:192 start_codon:yes stop_codon:yes gene_type:complete
MAESIANKSLKKIEIHEAECKVRYENIQARLDEGSAKFKRLESLIIGVYPFLLASLVFSAWLK